MSWNVPVSGGQGGTPTPVHVGKSNLPLPGALAADKIVYDIRGSKTHLSDFELIWKSVHTQAHMYIA